MGFRAYLDTDPISELPLRDVIAVHQDTLVRAAIAVMRSHDLGCAVIVDRLHQPLGLFTERSLLEVLVRGDSLDERPVGEYASDDFVAVQSTEPVARVWDAVQQHGVRFVVVTDEDGKLIGLTGQRGIAEYVAEYFPRQTAVQRLGSTPWMHQREGA